MNEIIKNNGVKFGIITGVASILITTILYVVDISLFVSMSVGFAIILFYLLIGIYLVSKTKKDLKGVISFKEAFTVYFISAIISIIISTIFNIVLFNYIDPEAKEALTELTVKSTVKMMQNFGAPTEEINKAVAKTKESNQFSVSGSLQSSVFSILFSAFFGLILAAVFKTSKSDYNQ